MEEEILTETIEIDGNEFFLVSSIEDGSNTYHFFANIDNQSDISILKDGKDESGDECYVSLDTEREFNYALSLFYQKNQNINNQKYN